MKEVPKETENMIKDSIEASNNEIPAINNTYKCVKEYTPFKFTFEHNVKEKKNIKKYFAFTYFDNSNSNSVSDKKTDKNNNSENEGDIMNESGKNKINEKNVKIGNTNNVNIINTSYNSHNSNNNVNHQIMGGLDNLIDIVKEDDENEYTESEEPRVDDYHSFNEADFLINYTIRSDSCLKIVVINIIETYNTLDPNYKYVKKEEEEKKIVLTVPSEPVKNNGKDNEEDDLIVFKEDEFKNKEKKETYIVKELLGTGASGQVFKVFCQNSNNYCALKIIKNKKFLLERSKSEVNIMRLLNNDDKNDQYHIIRLYDAFMFNNHFCIVIELLQNTLLQILEKSNSQGISLNSIRFILKQILQSVDFMHSLKLVHTDLKPENILLSVYKGENNDNRQSNMNLSYNLNNQKNNPNQINTNNNTSGINNTSNISLLKKRVLIKIADFGEAVHLIDLGQKPTIQTTFYRAPEVILQNRPLNEKIDIWSIGCILGELYLGTPLMPGYSNYDQLYKINILIGECPQKMIENSWKKNVFFIKDNSTYNYRIKKPDEYFSEYPKAPKIDCEIPKNMKNLDDLINIKKDIKNKSLLHKSMHNSSLSLNSSNTKEDLVALIHLMKCMLQIDPDKRWSCKQCLKHPFLTKEKLDKFIRFETNEFNQLMSNSFNSNNSYNFNNNNCHSMIMNNSFNKFQPNKGGNINKNNTFYGGNFNSKKRNNYSFGNFNINHNNNNNNNNNNYNNNYNNNNIFNYPQNPLFPPQFPQNYNMNNNNNLYQLNYNNNNFQGNNINNNKLNYSFSFKNNNNFNNMIPYNNLYQFNFAPNRMYPQNYMPYQNIPFYPNNLMYNINNNQNMNNRMNPNFNNQQTRYNNSYMATSFERLNTSYNSNRSKNSKNNNQQFHKNKKSSNPKELLFNKENVILGNIEDNNKQEIKNQDKDINYDNNNPSNTNTNNNINNNISENLNINDGGGNKINPEIDKGGNDPNKEE